ncbi:MAG: SBBP repeat-containing protein, partial [Acidobacteria bacterium]|nr:SBBP repeat-containing protein [Acidobacteriota bacterium]
MPRNPHRSHIRQLLPVALILLSVAALCWWASPVSYSAAAANVAPSVSISSPTNNWYFPHLSDISVTADASDADGDLSRVEFYQVSRGFVTLIGTDTTAPYGVVFEDAAGPNTYGIHAVAYDNAGLKTTSATVTVAVEYMPPIAQLASPANGAWFPAGSDITLTTQTDLRDGRIKKIEFYHSGPSVSGGAGIIGTATTAPFSFVWQDAPAGTYTLFVRTYDEAGLFNVASRNISIAVGEGHTALNNVSGRVAEHDGGPPVAGATVTLTGGQSGLPYLIRTTTTDADGRYNFAGVERHYNYVTDTHHPDFAFQQVPVFGLQDLTTDVTVNVSAKRKVQPAPAPGAPTQAWASFYNSPDNGADGVTLIALDGQGNVITTGRTSSLTDSSNVTTVKYDADGRQLWSATFDGAAKYIDFARDIAADAAGNVYVTGSTYGGRSVDYDYFTVKYDADGREVWRKIYNGPINMADAANALALDASGNVYVTGDSLGNGAG